MLAGLVQGSGCLRFLSRDDKTLSNAESTLVTGRVTRGVGTRKVRASTSIFVGHKTPKRTVSWEIDAYASLLSLPGERERQVGDRGDRGMWGSVTWEHLTPCLGQTWDQGGCFVGGPGNTNDLLETLSSSDTQTRILLDKHTWHRLLTVQLTERQTTLTVKW